MQNKAMRIIQNIKYNSSAKPIYKKLKVFPINQLYQQQLGKLMFMHHNSTLPPQIQKIFTINNTVINSKYYSITIQGIQMIHTFHNTLLTIWWYPVLYIKLQKYGTESPKIHKQGVTNNQIIQQELKTSSP